MSEHSDLETKLKAQADELHALRTQKSAWEHERRGLLQRLKERASEWDTRPDGAAYAQELRAAIDPPRTGIKLKSKLSGRNV